MEDSMATSVETGISSSGSETVEIGISPAVDISNNFTDDRPANVQLSTPDSDAQLPNQFPLLDTLQSNSSLTDMNAELVEIILGLQSNMIGNRLTRAQMIPDFSNSEARLGNRLWHSMRAFLSPTYPGFFWTFLIIVPFVVVKSLHNNDHAGISCIIILIVVFIITNGNLQREVIKQRERSKIVLVSNFIFIFAALALSWIFLEQFPIHIDRKYNSWVDLFWNNILTDYILKLSTISVKICFTLAPSRFIHFKRRGRYYELIEAISQVSRALFPMSCWVSMGFGFVRLFSPLVGIFCVAWKFFDTYRRVKLLFNAFIGIRRSVTYGSQPTKEELSGDISQCAICQGNFKSPIRLCCKHIFCKKCVLTWLEQECTCPLCRTVVIKPMENTIASRYSLGHTSFTVFLF